MTDVAPTTSRNPRVALVQGLLLFALCMVVFHPEVTQIAVLAVQDLEAAQLMAVPLLVAILLFRRRHALADGLTRGSLVGIVILLLALGFYAVASWPFNFGYPRRLAIVPAMAGAVLAVGGWRVCWHCLPLLLLLLLAIPIGSRYYASLIIKPETVTVQAVRAALELVPGVAADLEGPDLSYVVGGRGGAIALGEPNRGASLLMASAVVGVFVIFSVIRPWWQVVVAGVLAAPIILFCNFVRLFVWGLVTIVFSADPLAGFPRAIAQLSGLVLAYLLFVTLMAALSRIVTPEAATPTPAGGPA